MNHIGITRSFIILAISGCMYGCSRLSNPLADAVHDPQLQEITDENDIRFADDLSMIMPNDFYDQNNPEGLAKTEYWMGSPSKWHYRNVILPKQAGKLYWFLSSKCQDGIDERSLIKSAFAAWQPYVSFTFTEATTASAANIVIAFSNTKTYKSNNGYSYYWTGG